MKYMIFILTICIALKNAAAAEALKVSETDEVFLECAYESIEYNENEDLIVDDAILISQIEEYTTHSFLELKKALGNTFYMQTINNYDDPVNYEIYKKNKNYFIYLKDGASNPNINTLICAKITHGKIKFLDWIYINQSYDVFKKKLQLDREYKKIIISLGMTEIEIQFREKKVSSMRYVFSGDDGFFPKYSE